jgi:branched-chain amino acid aminotransferase
MEPTKLIWINGEMTPWEDANFHFLTHGLHYGTGVFEGIRAYETPQGTEVFRLTDHMERLRKGSKAYWIPVKYSTQELVDAVKFVVRENGLVQGYIRPLAFFGGGSMGLNPQAADPMLVIACWPWGTYLGEEGVRNGIRVKVSSWRRIDQSSFMPNAKGTGGYLNSVLAKQEALRAGYDEALLLNNDGMVSEGSGENLFVVSNGVVFTPPVASGILAGITRDSVMTILREGGYEVSERVITRSDVYFADELFLTGTAAEVTPVREVDDREIGIGKPGPITRFVQERYMAIVKGETPDHDEWREYV